MFYLKQDYNKLFDKFQNKAEFIELNEEMKTDGIADIKTLDNEYLYDEEYEEIEFTYDDFVKYSTIIINKFNGNRENKNNEQIYCRVYERIKHGISTRREF